MPSSKRCDQAIARGLSYAAYADMIWCEMNEPSLSEAKRFAENVKAKFPDKLLAYNCSPSFTGAESVLVTQRFLP